MMVFRGQPDCDDWNVTRFRVDAQAFVHGRTIEHRTSLLSFPIVADWLRQVEQGFSIRTTRQAELFT